MARAAKQCGIAETMLIENSGRAAAEEISRRYGACKAVVLCGTGSVGEIGRIAAGRLKSWGWPVDVAVDDFGEVRLIIDALHDVGSEYELSQVLADKVNGSNIPVISIDLPSGIDGVTGSPRRACFKADLCITFFARSQLMSCFRVERCAGKWWF
jgi:ADP-dependent NAD(P)H-hydrate dehydratase / NAD(P)H-hydrate epimerase